MTFKLLKQAVIGARVPMTVFDNLYAAKENDLKVITEFMPISARFIANKASYPFKKKALTTLLEKLQEVIG